MTEQIEDHDLDEANRHIVQAERNITKQKAIIEKLVIAGRDTIEAESLIVVFTEILQNMRARREHILRELDRIERGTETIN